MTIGTRWRLPATLTTLSTTLGGLGLLAACAAPGGAAGNGSTEPGTTVTSCGLELSFGEVPERVVTLGQSATETLLALGLQDRMVGTANLKTKVQDRFRAAYEQVPVLADELPGAERLRSAEPDLVVSAFESHFTRARVGTRQELRALGVPSYVSAVDCAADTGGGRKPFELLFSDYRALGKIFGVDRRAERLIAEQRAVLERIRNLRPTSTEPATVLWLYSSFSGVPYVAGADGMPSAMTALVGARNAFDDVDETWPEVSWEAVVERRPDVIVIADLSERGRPGDSAAEKRALLQKHPAVAELPAVRKNRIIEVPGIEMDPGVRTIQALRTFADGMTELGYLK